MPIYEYRCAACGKEFEELVFGRDEPPKCPACGAEHAERLLSGFAVGDGTGGAFEGGLPGALPAGGCGGSGGFS